MSSYLKAFQALQAELSPSFTLNSDRIIVEEIKPKENKTKSGIILAATSKQVDGIEANRPTFVRVLLVGKGFYDDETKEPIPLDVEPGDICLVGRLSVNWLSTFGPIISSHDHQLGYLRESEIHLRFHGQTGYEDVCNLLDKAVNDDGQNISNI